MTIPTREEIEQIPPDRIPAALVRLGEIQALLIVRLCNQTIPTLPSEEQEDRLLTIPEVARRLSVPKGFAYELIRRKHLPVIKLSERNTRVRESDLTRYLTIKKKIDSPLSFTYSSQHEGIGTKADQKTAGPNAKRDGPLDRLQLEQRGAMGKG